jgi:PhnB protein
MIQINPYLNYTGNCEEAFNFYRSVFGGEFTYFSRMGDIPEMEVNDQDKNKVMHVSLPIGENILMGSDVPSSMDSSTAIGNNISISVNLDNSDEARRIFEALAEGGVITMPLGETFWSPLFGMCIDKFGIPWMVGVDYA